MTEHQLHLKILSHQLDDELYFAQALGVRESSRVGHSAKAATRALLDELAKRLSAQKINSAFSHMRADVIAPEHLHRIAVPEIVTPLALSLTMLPPGRQVRRVRKVAEKLPLAGSPDKSLQTDTANKLDWLTPVLIRLDGYAWSEADDRHVGIIPSLNLHVLCERFDALESMLLQHAKLWLTRKTARAQLAELAQLARRSGAALEPHSITLNWPSVKQREQNKSSRAQTSVLAEVAERYADSSDAQAAQPAWCMHDDFVRLAELFVGPYARSVLIVAPAGAGKSTLVAGLAMRRNEFDLSGREFWHSSGARLVAGQSGYGQWQERCQSLCRELAKSRAVLHLGSLTELMEVGRTRAGEQSIAGFLRQEITLGNILILAECTPEALSAIEHAEPGMVTAFQQFVLAPPDSRRTGEILQLETARLLGSARALESQPGLRWLQRLHQRYAGYSAHPARALRFLRARIAALPPECAITEANVTQAFAQETGLPVLLLDDTIEFSIDTTRAYFAERVLGQTQAIAAVLARLAEIKAQLHRAGRPLASLLLIGPTGTGKTELAKSLASFLFGSSERLLRFDLSQLSDAASVQRLIGSAAMAAPEGLLTAKVREQPFCVLLLDEFEKAHPSFFDLLLQILGDARLTDGSGRVADFSNAVIVLTSNLGAKDAARARIGFAWDTINNPTGVQLQTQERQTQERQIVERQIVERQNQSNAHFERAVQNFVRPELYNRFDAIVPFVPLTASQIHAIAAREVNLIAARAGLVERNVHLSVSLDVIAYLAELGFDAQFGARALKRVIERELSGLLAHTLSEPDAFERAHSGTQISPFSDTASVAAPVHWRVELVGQKLQIIKSLQQNVAAQTPTVLSGLARANGALDARSQITRTQTVRRKVEALLQCDRVATLTDELALLKIRAARANKRKQALTPVELNRIDLLTPQLNALKQLHGQAVDLEDLQLAQFWQAQNASGGGASGADIAQHPQTPSAAEMSQTLQLSLRAVFRLGFSRPDTVRFAVFSEHAQWLLDMTLAYQAAAIQAAGTFEILAVIERPANAKEVMKLIELKPPVLPVKRIAQIKRPELLLTQPQSQLLGMLIEVTGDLFLPMFSAEFGLHTYKPLKTDGAERVALVEWAKNDYQPRAILARSGGLGSLNLPVRRAFFCERLELEDAHLAGKKRKWMLSRVQSEIAPLMQAYLQRAIDSVHAPLTEIGQ